MRYENIVIIEGLDGSGKSTAALQTAKVVSDAYRKLTIDVADSTGLYCVRRGKVSGHSFAAIDRQKPQPGLSPIKQASQAFRFALTRRRMNRIGEKSDLLISVRDPDRLEPAIYSSVYGASFFRLLTVQTRLQIFDKFTHAAYASAIVLLHTDVEGTLSSVQSRGQQLDPHEDPEVIQRMSRELPEAVHAYEKLFGAAALEVEGLRDSTIDELANMLVQIAGNRSTA